MTTLFSNDELCIVNPYSVVTCFLTYLYSLEIGHPSTDIGFSPLYLELDNVSRNKDEKSLKNLGPFARAFSEIVVNGEKRRNDTDRFFLTGLQTKLNADTSNLKGLKHNIDGMFLLWSGCMMK